ncbi:peptidase S49 [Hyphomicrobium denitrificans ATCC 51888]|uniref:Peptidase S49 n=1 Tax=Hyphomicrobium denitrificans (strain ATCC 51888 / DSM 1869 / NCIMB 11706 / TK 0415) TaxID=582899 RepID=D8JUN1_HYPDA|nr:S49 family peptidase [Hyphomicrobium denitrificans]ADJ24661.1 peptidase S49 [Hyphomicrobium denitrificans ATCC 51888]
MWPFSRRPFVPVLRFHGPIGMATPLRPGLTLGAYSNAIEKAFLVSKLPAVAVIVNSPGGSPVQSNLLFKRIRQLAVEKKKRVYVFCEDVAASGGYFLAIAGDEIYADPSSIIGSIGVVSRSFGFVDLLEKIGVERRVYTAGINKNQLDPFLPEDADDVARLKAIQRDVHDIFIGLVKERRLGKLKAPDTELFSGAFWSAARAVEFGLVDGITDIRSKMQDIFGEKIRLKVIEPEKPGLLARLRRTPGAIGIQTPALAFADDLVSAVETRTLWSRFGL